MRTKTWMAGVTLMGVLAAGAHAQLLGTIAANPQTVKAGEPVTITATIDVVNANYCGFVVGFGDGSFQDGVSDNNTPSPLVVKHTYAKAGQYSVTLGGRNVQSHPNCAGPERAVAVTVTGSAATAGKASASAANLCPTSWKLVPKSSNAKTGAFACSAKRGTALPEVKPTCPGELTYYENGKKGQLGCRP